LNCPNCGRSNTADAAYCFKCGFRLPTAAARGAGVAYRRAEQAEPHGGGGQGLLAFGAVLLAGMLFAVGAVALFLSAPTSSASPTSVSNVTPEATLPIFVQPTASPSPEPSPTLAPSVFGSPSLLPSVVPSLPIETPIIVPTPTPTPTRTFVLPTPTPPRATPTPPRPTPTPGATPPNCAAADGSNMKTITLGFGNPPAAVNPKAWCIHQVIIRPFIASDPNNPATGEPGRTRLLESGRRLMATTCAPESCNDFVKSYPEPHFTPAGSTLEYQFTCQDNPNTPETDECTDADAGGATIEIQYEPLPGT